jgi:predicted transcriptional regulator
MTVPRAARVRELPPPLELLCLDVVWRLGEASVKDVREALAPARALAHTTVQTLLERLVHRGTITRRKQGRAALYSPVVSRNSLREVAVEELIRCFFGGSRGEFEAYVAATAESTSSSSAVAGSGS